MSLLSEVSYKEYGGFRENVCSCLIGTGKITTSLPVYKTRTDRNSPNGPHTSSRACQRVNGTVGDGVSDNDARSIAFVYISLARF